MTISIRPVTPDDVEALVALGLRAWAPVHASMAAVLGPALNRRIYPDWAASQADDIRHVCTDPETQTIVAEEDGQMLGFAAVVIHRDGVTGEVDMIATDPAEHRRGVGALLTERCLELLRAQGCTLAVIATGGDDGHAPARALYESAGFTALPLVRYYREL